MIRALLTALVRFHRHRGMAHAAEMAVSALLALFPLLILVGWLVARFEAEHLLPFVQRLLFIVWPRSIAAPMVMEANAVLKSISGTGILPAMIVAPLLISNAIEALRNGLNDAYGPPDRLPFLRARLQSVTLAIVAIATLLAMAWALSMAATIPTMDAEGTRQGTPTGAFWLVPLAGLAFVVAGLFAAHALLPRHGANPHRAWPGVLLTCIIWLVAGYGFAFYAENIAGFQTTYGGYASALLTLILFVITAASILVGAELNDSCSDA